MLLSFLFNLLVFLPVSQLLCHPQKIILTHQSSADSLMNNTNASQSKVCHGCRKLFSYDPPIRERSDEEITNTEATTLLGDIVADDSIVDGNQESYVISNSDSGEALVSARPLSNFVTNNLNERSMKGLEETRASNSEMFQKSGGINSMTNAFTGIPEESRRIISTSHTTFDTLQTDVLMNERNGEYLEETRTSDSEKFGDSGNKNSMTGSSPQRGEVENESYIVRPDGIGSLDQKNFEVSESAMFVYPKQTNAKQEENNFKSYAYAERSETDNGPLGNFFDDQPHQESALSLYPEKTNAEWRVNNLESYPYAESLNTDHGHLSSVDTLVSNEERQTGLLSDYRGAGADGLQSFQYNQPITINGKTSEKFNEATEITAMNRDSYAAIGISSPGIESSLPSFQNNDELEKTNEIASSKNIIWNVAWNQKNLQVPENMHQKVEEPKALRQVNDEWDVEDEKLNFNAVNRDTKSIGGNPENSESVDATTELTSLLTNVNGVVLKDPAKRLKSNRTLNLFESNQEECEQGSGNCLACRGISPYCHYNFRGKQCFYADVVHGNTIYECGIRFFTSDGYEPFWIALGILIFLSLVVTFFLSRAFYKRILQKDPVTDMEVNDMHNIVHLIREKRSIQKKLLKRIGQIRREDVVDELESERLVETEDE